MKNQRPDVSRKQEKPKKELPDYLKFKGHKPKPKKKKSEDKSFVTYQKKTNPYFQTKKSNKKK